MPMTSMVLVSSALLSAVASLKYFSVTSWKNGFSPQYLSLPLRAIESPRVHFSSVKGPVPTGAVASLSTADSVIIAPTRVVIL